MDLLVNLPPPHPTPKANFLIYLSPGLTVKNFLFGPQSAFICHVWILGQTAFISAHSVI
jgi:hypothetical protein